MINIDSLEYKLDRLIEECAELIHIASKVKRFGMNNFHPESKVKNSIALLNEIMDVLNNIERVREDIPRPTIDEMVEEVLEWYDRSEKRVQAEFRETDFKSLPVFHSSLGEAVRNRFNLWYYPWNKKVIEGVDVSPNHPDAISMRVIEETWRRINAS